ncbi:Uncharacterised protein [Cedecea davisae]|nr:Uncharacterised protein [Cedecea davisae]
MLAFKLQEKKQVIGEWWLVNAYQFKGMVSDGISTKKIMVVSGSNSLFSIDSDIISNKTRMPVVNLATHAGLDINYHAFIIKKYMKPGDVVVMPLEYEYYTSNGKPTDWFVNNMTGWGHDYLSTLDTYDYIKFLANITPRRLWEGLTATDKNYVDPIEIVEQRITKSDGNYYGYNYKSFNHNGDINFKSNSKTVYERIEKGSFDYFSDINQLSPYALKKIKEIKYFVEKNNGKFILTWPVTMRNPSFDTSKKETKENLNHIKRMLADSGINIYCSPTASNLDSQLFIDSQYHTNGYGAFVRSSLLGECLNEIINKKNTNNDDIDYRSRVLELEKQTPYY